MRDQCSVFQKRFPSTEPTLWCYSKSLVWLHLDNFKRAVIKTIWQSGNGSCREGALRERHTLQTAACRIASNPPSGASLLRDTICFWTSWLKRSTSSVRDKMWRKPNVGTQFGNNLYLRVGTDGEKIRRETRDAPVTITALFLKIPKKKNTTKDTKLLYSQAQTFLNLTTLHK